MFEKNKFIFIGVGVCLVAWWILYASLVTPNWSQRDEEVSGAEENLERWAKYYKPAKGSIPYPEAAKALDEEQKLLTVSQKRLEKIEFIADKKDFGPYDLQRYKGPDPMNYFDKLRTKLFNDAKDEFGVTLNPGMNDLGFRGRLTEDPVEVNLMRMFVLRRFLTACKEAGVATIVKVDYPKIEMLPVDSGDSEGESSSDMALIQVPLTVALRAKERDFAQFLFELQRPTTDARSYFCLRGFQVDVRDKASGELDAQVAVGALFPKKVYTEDLKIPFSVGKRRAGGFNQPMPQPDRY